MACVTTVSSNNAGAARAACTGKCMGAACAAAPKVWVLAACGAMLSLFEKGKDGRLSLVRMNGASIAPTVEDCQYYLKDGLKKLQFQQLVLVGSANDVVWAQALLPQEVASLVVAEINYPLVTGWFRESAEMEALQKALEQVLKS